MFRSKSSSFNKLPCPYKETRTCPFGPNECIFAHDPEQVTKYMQIPSLGALKRLVQQRMDEVKAIKAVKPAEEKEAVSSTSAIVEAVKAGKMDGQLHRFPACKRVSWDLRRKGLVVIMESVVGQGLNVAEAAQLEAEIMKKCGPNCTPSIYLSQLTGYKRFDANAITNEPKTEATLPSTTIPSYPALLPKLVATLKVLEAHEFPNADRSMEAPMAPNKPPSTAKCRDCKKAFSPYSYYQQFDFQAENALAQSKAKGNVCIYHPGRKERTLHQRIYTCCHGSVDNDATGGCESRPWHVFESPRNPITCPTLHGLKMEVTGDSSDTIAIAAALDAEMLYTVGGYEAGRVTLVDFFTEKVLIDVLVRPRHQPVIEYNTRWSGLSAELFDSNQLPVLTFEEMLKLLRKFVDPDKTILIGHSLENDLRVLQLAHELIIDTSILFKPAMAHTHVKGPGYMRISLKNLALAELSEFIQQGGNGHDSCEDCITCIKLVKKKCLQLQNSSNLVPV